MGRRPDAKSGRRSCALAVRRRDGPVGRREARVARRAPPAGLDALPAVRRRDGPVGRREARALAAATDFDSVLHSAYHLLLVSPWDCRVPRLLVCPAIIAETR